MGKKRKKKTQEGNQPKIVLSVPLPDNDPNWDEPHEVMMSVVMEKVPERFAEDWFCVICPVAKRRTVVANQGWTCSYNKLLALDRKFQSALPGGNINFLKLVRNHDMCILDCLHYKAERTFFVLDLMFWKQMPYYETEAEFRFHWIDTKLAEVESATISILNEYKFCPMPRLQCTQEKIVTALKEVKFKVDGLLFFHKEGLYQIGVTPSVLWLQPQNMERVLGFAPPDNVLPQKTFVPASSSTPAPTLAGAAAAPTSATIASTAPVSAAVGTAITKSA